MNGVRHRYGDQRLLLRSFIEIKIISAIPRKKTRKRREVLIIGDGLLIRSIGWPQNPRKDTKKVSRGGAGIGRKIITEDTDMGRG